MEIQFTRSHLVELDMMLTQIHSFFLEAWLQEDNAKLLFAALEKNLVSEKKPLNSWVSTMILPFKRNLKISLINSLLELYIVPSLSLSF
jgi:hypothetical protein